MRSTFLTILLGLSIIIGATPQTNTAESVTIMDAQHYSHVFGEMRNYRIFLPPRYYSDPAKNYPVIYFLHGWSQRFFGSGPDPYSEYDQGDDANGDNIEQFVLHHEVIVVKSDGYNRDKDEAYYLRPYNIGPVETHRQFPIYYREFIDHIDQSYRTIADRSQRAISGLSMGGFMSFFIGGKYPDLFCAVGSFCGSPEFAIGPKEMPVEYRHMDMYQNYNGIKVRLHYGDQDFIRSYHEDLNRIWTQVMDQYTYKIFPGDEHTTSGLNEMFGHLYDTFKNPVTKPSQWSHTDIYPQFTVWDYEISSDRTVPGLTVIENVDARGFTSVVREFLPDGSTLAQVNLSILTPAIYEKNQNYIINDYNSNKRTATQRTSKSDHLGRLSIRCDGAKHHIGINRSEDMPNLSIIDYQLDNMDWAISGRKVLFSLVLFNNGMTPSDKLKVKLSTLNEGVEIETAESLCENIGINQKLKCLTPFAFEVQDDSTEIVKFTVEIDNGKSVWWDHIIVPIKKNLPEIRDFIIADGGIYTVAKGGNDLETVQIGQGNGDGVPNPGEYIEVLMTNHNRNYRTQITENDACINPLGINLRKTDYWGNYDHVGSSVKNSILVIASDCLPNTQVDLGFEYWLPDKPLHIIKRGKISINISGSDQTAPAVDWMEIGADNNLQVKLYDGATIQEVSAIFIDEEKHSFQVPLNDKGKTGDQVESDRIFSTKVPPQKFGFYRVIIEATDAYSNQSRREMPGTFLLH